MEAVTARRPELRGFALPRRYVAGIAAPLALCVLAGALRFWGLGRQGFWYDEATTAWLLRGSPAQLLSRLPHTESTPPLYYLVAWVWSRVFGDTEAGLRSLSALAGVAAVPATFLAARELAGRRAALFAGLVVAVNPLLVWYSQEARSYSLLVLASALSLWLFARARARPDPVRLVAWGAASAAALCTHYFAAFFVLPEALLLLGDRRGAVRWRLAAAGIPLLTCAALVALAHVQSHRIYHFAQISLSLRMRQIVQYSVIGFSPPSGFVAFGVVGLAIALALALLTRRSAQVDRRAVLAAATIGATAVLLPEVLAVLGLDYLNARNVIGAIAPLAVVVAAGLAATGRKAVSAGLAAVVAAVSIAMVVEVQANIYAQRPHWRVVAEALAYRGIPRAILVLHSPTWVRPLGFYLPRTWLAPSAGKRVSEIDVLRRTRHAGSCTVGVWWGALCNLTPHPRLKSAPVAGFRLVSTRRVVGFAIDRYRSARPIRVYSRWPFERPAARGKQTLMVTPTAAPRTP